MQHISSIEYVVIAVICNMYLQICNIYWSHIPTHATCSTRMLFSNLKCNANYLHFWHFVRVPYQLCTIGLSMLIRLCWTLLEREKVRANCFALKPGMAYCWRVICPISGNNSQMARQLVVYIYIYHYIYNNMLTFDSKSIRLSKSVTFAWVVDDPCQAGPSEPGK